MADPLLRRLAGSLALCACLCAGVGRAANDPARRWASLESAHFVVHYYYYGEGGDEDDGRAFAAAVAAYAEEARAALGPLFDWYPRERVHVAVLDEGDSANGFAATLPEPRMTIFAWPPTGDSELGHYANWVKLLVFHEYAHIVHIDESHGIPDAFNSVFGRVWKPNQILPRWVVEGLAVWVESTRTGGGRLRSGLMDMWLRLFVMNDAWPTLDALSGFPLTPPRATAWYLIGGHLFETMVRHAGPEAVAAFSDLYGGRVLPLGVQGLARDASGRTWQSWYALFQKERTESVKASLAAIEARGPIEGRPFQISDDRLEDLRFSPDGRWLYLIESDGHRQSRIARVAVETLAQRHAAAGDPDVSARLKDSLETVVRCYGGCSAYDISPDGRRLAFTTARFRRVGDLFGTVSIVDLEAPLARRVPDSLPASERAHDVIFSRDGRSVWCVRSRWGRTWLERFDLTSGASVARIDAPVGLDSPGNHARFERPTLIPNLTPALIPGSDDLAVVIHTRGNRDLWRVGASGAGPFERWTRGGDDVIDLIAFRGHREQGARLLFASDRGGVFNIFALDPADPERVVQLTRERVGALNPALSPDGRWLAYTRFTPEGRALVLRADPFQTAQPPEPERPLRPFEPLIEVPLVPRDYDAVPTLTPRRWLPSLSLGSVGAGRLGLAAQHSDASRRWVTSLGVEQDFELGDWSGVGRVGWRGGLVDLTLDGGRYVFDRVSVVGDLEEDYRQEIVYASLFASIPAPDVFAGLSLGLGYTVELARGFEVGRLEERPDQSTPLLPREGLSGFLNIGLGWNDTRAFLFSPGPADGFSGQFNLALRHPSIGSWSESYAASVSMRGFLTAPWHPDHVLMLRFGAGISGGPGGGRTMYSLGGSPNRDLLADLLNQTTAGAVWLRGFPAGAFQGRRFVLGTAELRLPIARLRRGVGTLPAFSEDLTLALFSDVGGAASDERLLPALHAGVGVEVRTRLDLFWGLVSDLRLGYARGTGPFGLDSLYLLLAGAP